MAIYKYVVKDNDLFGADILRQSDSTLPLAYRPTVEHTNRQSANKLNHNQTVNSIVPVTQTIDGLLVSNNSYKATFKFSALQHISDDAKANQAIDALLAYINTNRATIIEGSKPLAATDLTVTVTKA